MTWFDYILIAWWIFSALMLVGEIGKPRKPLQPLTGVVSVLITLGLIAGLLFSRGAL